MIERITSGEHLLGFNVIGSYVVLRQRKDPDLGLVYPGDYVLVMSRVAFITKNARRPNAGKLFMDYLLSARAQKIMANQATLFSLRDDVDGPYSAGALAKELGSRLKPIGAGQAPAFDPQMAGNRARSVAMTNHDLAPPADGGDPAGAGAAAGGDRRLSELSR